MISGSISDWFTFEQSDNISQLLDTNQTHMGRKQKKLKNEDLSTIFEFHLAIRNVPRVQRLIGCPVTAINLDPWSYFARISKLCSLSWSRRSRWPFAMIG